MSGKLHRADRTAFERAITVKPVWHAMDTAASAMGLDKNVLLHAGPPFASVSGVCKPIMNSACVAAVYEGLAKDFDQAEAMIFSGEVVLKPAQDHCVVTPLAAVVSASMPLHVVTDENNIGPKTYAPVNGGSRPAMRLGIRSQAVLDHIRWLNGAFSDLLQECVASGIPLLPLAVHGLRHGDDCHGRTVMAAERLIKELTSNHPNGIQDKDAMQFMQSSPSLFLNLWMAASKCSMSAAEGLENSSFVTAIGGNGVETGVQIAGLAKQWFTVKASPPNGAFDVDVAKDRALGAIGDSAVVEGFGLGAMTIEHSPEQKKNLSAYLPEDYKERFEKLPAGRHPEFGALNVSVGLCARSIVALKRGPIVGLGILDKAGELGRLGGGIYDVPVKPFKDALQAMEKSS